MSNMIPMGGYPVPVRPYSQITPFTYRDNSTYLEILEQIRTWIQNTLVPHLDSEYEELVQSWADNIELLTTQYQTLLDDQATTLRGEFVTADDALDSRIDSLTATVASNDASVRSAFAAADAALQSQITTINNNVAAMNTSIRADFAAADAVLQTNIDTVDTDTNARIDDIIANSVTAQDSVVAGLVNSNTSLTNTALNNKYATDADMNAANAHLTSVDGSITSLSGRMTTAEGTIASHTSSIATNESAISTTNTNLGTTNSNVSALTTRVTTAEGNITTHTSDINTFKAASPRAVASASARDAMFPAPVQGNTVFRSDTGFEERYYAAYNSSSNPGGRTPAGWYTGQEGGITPVTPTSVSVTGGSASVSDNGKVTFSAVTSIALDGVFSSKFDSYLIMYSPLGIYTQTHMFLLRSGGSDDSTANYYYQEIVSNAYNSVTSYGFIGGTNGRIGYSLANYRASMTMNLLNPANSSMPTDGNAIEGYAQPYISTTIFGHSAAKAFDGIKLFLGSGTLGLSGTIEVFGYRK